MMIFSSVYQNKEKIKNKFRIKTLDKLFKIKEEEMDSCKTLDLIFDSKTNSLSKRASKKMIGSNISLKKLKLNMNSNSNSNNTSMNKSNNDLVSSKKNINTKNFVW